MKSGALNSSEAASLLQEFEELGKHHEGSEHSVAFVTLDLDPALTNPRDVKVDSLARRFEEITVFDEFVDGWVLATSSVLQPSTMAFCKSDSLRKDLFIYTRRCLSSVDFNSREDRHHRRG